MLDTYDTKPDPAAREAARAEIIAFREANPTLTRTGLAVAFVHHRGGATSAELSTLLGLGADEYPSVVLSSAVQNGRLVREGKNWKLGPKKVAYQPEDESVFPTAAPSAAPAATPNEKPKADVLQVPTLGGGSKRVELAPPTLPASRYRFGMWSDGQIEIQRSGVQLACLPRDVVEELVMFYASVRSVA